MNRTVIGTVIGLLAIVILFCYISFCLSDGLKQRDQRVRQETEAILEEELYTHLQRRLGIEEPDIKKDPGSIEKQIDNLFDLLEKGAFIKASHNQVGSNTSFKTIRHFTAEARIGKNHEGLDLPSGEELESTDQTPK